MTKEGIRSWALRSGFTEAQDGVLSVDYLGGKVEVSFGMRNVRVAVAKGAERRVLVSANPRNAVLDEHDMVHGIGLSESFLAGVGHDEAPPPWMTVTYLTAVGYPWTDEPAPAPGP